MRWIMMFGSRRLLLFSGIGDALSQFDEEHSEDEERYTIVGRSLHTRTLFVVHVIKSTRIRIISARQATPTERRDYEAQLGR